MLVLTCSLSCRGQSEEELMRAEAEQLPSYLAVDARAASAEAPPIFGVGRAATSEEIARLDIDIRPDGEGLPAGSGTVQQGRDVYNQRCIACHGVDGRDGPFDQLVGTEAVGPDGRPRTIGNYWPFATTLFDYVRRAMPFDSPGSLSDEEVYSAVAFLLYLNDIIAEDQIVDATSLPSVQMPARGDFVPDDRLRSTRVR